MGRKAALLWSYATTPRKVSRRTLGVVLDGEAAPRSARAGERDPHFAGYYAPATRTRTEESLGNRGGAKLRRRAALRRGEPKAARPVVRRASAPSLTATVRRV